jgi:CrcB protein
MEYLAVALGGAAGSVLRYALSTFFRTAVPGSFPLGTLVVNLLGSFLIGLCAAWLERGMPWIRPWLMAGFLGGFTTFSAFSLENMKLLRDGHLATALGYTLLSVCAGILLAFAGYALARGTT